MARGPGVSGVPRTPGLRFVTVTKRGGEDSHGEWSPDLVAPGRLIPRRVVALGPRPAWPVDLAPADPYRPMWRRYGL